MKWALLFYYKIAALVLVVTHDWVWGNTPVAVCQIAIELVILVVINDAFDRRQAFVNGTILNW